jgi:hypothetical protein
LCDQLAVVILGICFMRPYKDTPTQLGGLAHAVPTLAIKRAPQFVVVPAVIARPTAANLCTLDRHTRSS